MLDTISRWFDDQRQALVQRRVQRQQTRNEDLWDSMNIAHGTRVVDRLVIRAIDRGGDLQATVPDGHGRASGETPFTWALQAGRWSLALDLLKQGADPAAPTRASPGVEWRTVAPVGRWGFRPIGTYPGTVPADELALVLLAQQVMDRMAHPSVVTAAWKTVDALLEKRANGSRSLGLYGGSTALHQAVMLDPQLSGWTVERLQRLDVNHPDAHGCTPLHWAMNPSDRNARHHDLGAAQRLMRAGADPHAVDHRGHTPLHVLAENVRVGDLSPNWLRDMIQTWPDLDWNRPDAQGVTPFDLIDHPEQLASEDRSAYDEVRGRLQAHRVEVERGALHAVVANEQRSEVSLDPHHHGPDASMIPRVPARPRL